jgi:hypothetical protein
MYDDTDSIKAFERQHTRDRLRELARSRSNPPNTDAWSGASAAAAREAGLMLAICAVAAAALLGSIAYVLLVRAPEAAPMLQLMNRPWGYL